MKAPAAADLLEVDQIEKSFKETKAVDRVSFGLRNGEFVTLLGPSGCGKTTTLRAIAGFETIDSGRIAIDGQIVSDPAKGLHVAPESRHFGMVFQSYAVWPHMTVAQNVAYGLHHMKLSRAESKDRVLRVLSMVGLEKEVDRPATMLSGGQQQRVALARAIVYEPKVLLFDEPLSNLDAKLRERMRLELRRLQAELGITSVYVTHDQEEAMVVSDRVIVMEKGRIRQIGNPQEIYDRPVSRYVAEFIGSANIFPAKVREVDAGSRSVLVEAQVGERALPLRAVFYQLPPPLGTDGFVCIRNENISIAASGASAAPGRNVIAGIVQRQINMGSYMECLLVANGHEIIVRAPRSVVLAEGSAVDLLFAQESCLYLEN
ncbi:MAG TPA: ABC transporter ATP-binding protein [Pseudolabrys sp.]|jgi:iron(III) transport system ATP-binding protein|nr:ABC transporter ATP-binding protein [Pseudolabrys sp.]